MYGGGSLASRRRPGTASVFQFLGTVMPEGEGSLLDDLDAALQSGPSGKIPARNFQRMALPHY